MQNDRKQHQNTYYQNNNNQIINHIDNLFKLVSITTATSYSQENSARKRHGNICHKIQL